MTVSRLLCLVVLGTVASIPWANAQLGGAPGTPGTDGSVPLPQPACQQVLALRDETQKSVAAIRAFADKASAEHKPIDPVESCKLFETFLASDSKYIQGMQTDAQTCGISPTIITQAQEKHITTIEISKQVCAAAQHLRPIGPARPADPIRDTLDGLRPDKPQSPFPAYDPYFVGPHY